MTEIERLISRHLDGELTPSEETRLRKLLVESHDARALMREMTVLSRAARRTPVLYAPQQRMEKQLFQRLQAEGLRRAGALNAQEMASAPALSYRGGVLARLRGPALVLAIVITIIGGGFLIRGYQGADAPMQAQAVTMKAAAVAANRGLRADLPPIIVNDTMRAVRSTARDAAGSSAARQPERVLGPEAGMEAPNRSLAVDAIGSSAADSALAHGRYTENVREIQMPPAFDFPSVALSADMREGMKISASLRGGLASIQGTGSNVRDLSVRVGMEINGGHQIAFLAGSSPTLAEIRQQNTGMAAPVPSRSHTNRRFSSQEHQLPEYQQAAGNEPWLGVGYNYSVSVLKGLSVDPGVRAGLGTTSWRLGLEVPIRYHLGGNVSMECALSATRVVARSSVAEETTMENAASHFLYTSLREQASFNSFGIQFGVRVDLSGHE